MPGVTVTAPQTDLRPMALAQVRGALRLIVSDPYARSLLPSTSAEPFTSDEPSTSTALADWLYAHWWCGPGLRADRLEPADAATRADAERGAARLEASRRTTAARSAGWLVLAAVGDVLVAARLGHGPQDPRAAGRRITTTPDAVVASSRPGLPPRPGDLVTVRHGASGLDPAYAWWWAHSTRPEDLSDLPLDRWYVHARDLDAATRLVPLLLAAVAEADCPVTLKCPPTEAGYGRRDALVVYLPRDRSEQAERALLRQAAAIEPLVRPDLPPLTRPMLPGVARAEDPGRGTADDPVSYGQLRCRQVATLADSLCGGRPRQDLNRLDDDTLVDALAATGLDVDAIERVS